MPRRTTVIDKEVKRVLRSKLLIAFLCITVGSFFALACSGDGSPESTGERKDKEKESLEYQLAVINAGYPVSEDDVTVTRFRYLLEQIEKKTTNSRQEIADMTVKGQQLLRDDYGKEVKLLDLMEAANKSIPPDLKMDYAEIMAALVVLMKE